MLTGDSSVPRAARKVLEMGPQALVIKHGEYGATLFFREGSFGLGAHHPFRAPALPIEEVHDPTGAGDSFAGGFMGYIASQQEVTPLVLKQRDVLWRRDGLLCRGTIRTRALAVAHPREIDERFELFRSLTHLTEATWHVLTRRIRERIKAVTLVARHPAPSAPFSGISAVTKFFFTATLSPHQYCPPRLRLRAARAASTRHGMAAASARADDPVHRERLDVAHRSRRIIPSMIAYVLGVIGIFRLIRALRSRNTAVIAAAIYALNPNLLYMQSTAMTESIFLATVIWSVVYLDDFVSAMSVEGAAISDRYPPHKSLEKCAMVLAAAILTRYDGWVLAAICGLIVVVVLSATGAASTRRLSAHSCVPPSPSACSALSRPFFGFH